MKRCCVLILVACFIAISPLMAGAAEPAKPTCAVMTLDAREGITAGQASFLSDRFEVELGRLDRFTLMSRSNMGKILEAQQFSLTCAGAECAIEAGKLLSIQAVTFGSVGKIGQTYSVNVFLANVESGAVEKQESYSYRGEVDGLLDYGMENAARKLLGLPVKEVPSVYTTVASGTGARSPVPAVVPASGAGPWENSLGMRFVPVTGAEVLFSVWETRVKDYQAFIASAGREWEAPRFAQGPDHPVVKVSWEDAQAFCSWLTERERAGGRLTGGQEYRLPTDAEWSLAVGLGREAGSTPHDKDEHVKNVYPWGGQWSPPRGAGNYEKSLGVDDFDQTAPVGSFTVNPSGLFDLGGNVWEWCGDFYDGRRRARVLRGGSYIDSGSRLLLSSVRNINSSGFRSGCNGFRCVLSR